MTSTIVSRRQFVWQAGVAVSGLAFDASLLLAQGKPNAGQFALRHRDDQWQAWHLNEFLDLISDQDRWALKQSLGLEGNKTKGRLRGHAADIDDILEELLWHSSHFCSYWFRDEWSIRYHSDVVVWCAKELGWLLGISKVDADRPTFVLEQQLLVGVLLRLWNLLSEERQNELLKGLIFNDPKARAQHAAKQGEIAAKAIQELQNHKLIRLTPALEKIAKVLDADMVGQAMFLLAQVAESLMQPTGWLPQRPSIPDIVKRVGKWLRAALRLLKLGGASATETLPFILVLHCIKVEHQLKAGIPVWQIFP